MTTALPLQESAYLISFGLEKISTIKLETFKKFFSALSSRSLYEKQVSLSVLISLPNL